MREVFLTEAQLMTWSDQGAAQVDGSRLDIGAGQVFTLHPAVRFLSALAGDDLHALIGKVKTHAQLDEMGAEHIADSVILGDVAYQVTEGFLGRDTAAANATLTPQSAAVPPPRAPATRPVRVRSDSQTGPSARAPRTTEAPPRHAGSATASSTGSTIGSHAGSSIGSSTGSGAVPRAGSTASGRVVDAGSGSGAAPAAPGQRRRARLARPATVETAQLLSELFLETVKDPE